ncbi:hypothetical protein AABD41_01710 [Staphylococcus pseudoxylosus]|uniref:hypothetical protein n=1 Tax=Staphylococcus pseudoxylosus TaxID=2282419 RepID=UPI00398B55EA
MQQDELFDIKKLVVDTNNDGKLIAHLPKHYWKNGNEELLHSTIKKLDEIEISDIEIEYVESIGENKVYTISIHKFLRYALISQPNGDVSFNQLEFVE